MDKRRRCWKPKQKAPVISDLSSTCTDLDVTILRRLQERHGCAKFPYEIFGRRDFRGVNHVSFEKRQPVHGQDQFYIKQEISTPAQSPAVDRERCVSLSTPSSQTLRTSFYLDNQLFKRKDVKPETPVGRFAAFNDDDEQTKIESCFMKEEPHPVSVMMQQNWVLNRKCVPSSDSQSSSSRLFRKSNCTQSFDRVDAEFAQSDYASFDPTKQNCVPFSPLGHYEFTKPNNTVYCESWITQNELSVPSAKELCIPVDIRSHLSRFKRPREECELDETREIANHTVAQPVKRNKITTTAMKPPLGFGQTAMTGDEPLSTFPENPALPSHTNDHGTISNFGRFGHLRQLSLSELWSSGGDGNKLESADISDKLPVALQGVLKAPESLNTTRNTPVSMKTRKEVTQPRSSRDRIQQKLQAGQGNKPKASSPISEHTVRHEGETMDEDPTSATAQDPGCIEHVGRVGQEKKRRLAARLQTCTLASFLVQYEDLTTNTDPAALDRPKVKGILLQCDTRTYLFPPVQCEYEDDVSRWSRNLLNTLLCNDKVTKVAINCKQLVTVLLRDFSLGHKRGTLCWHFEDPIVAGWLLSPDEPPATLSTLCKTAGITHKAEVASEGTLTEIVAVMEKLRLLLKKEGLWSLFRHVEMPLTPLLAAMELRPIRVNVQDFGSFSAVLRKKLHKVEEKAFKLAGHSFCINSTQQLRQVLYEELKLDQKLPSCKKVTLTTITQHKSTSEPMLRQLSSTHPLPAVILEYRHLQKLKSTYIDGMVEATENGVMHTHWEQTAAATGRLASSQPNLQAVPKTATTITDYEDNFIVGSEPKTYEIYAREPYVCNEGNVFLAADFQQIELRLLAHLTNDPGLKAVFHSDTQSGDVFVQLTSQWKKTVDLSTRQEWRKLFFENHDADSLKCAPPLLPMSPHRHDKDPGYPVKSTDNRLSKSCQDVSHVEREQTKRVVYSILYGVGKERLAEYLKVSSTTAKDIMDSFLVTFPAVQSFTRKCIQYARQHGYTESVMGRKRWFPKVRHRSTQIRAQAERQAVNFCVQGSAADLCKQAMLRVEEALRERPHLSARLLIHIHDELMWELPQDQLQETSALIRQVMEDDKLLCRPLLSSLQVPVSVSLSSGTTWARLQTI